MDQIFSEMTEKIKSIRS